MLRNENEPANELGGTSYFNSKIYDQNNWLLNVVYKSNYGTLLVVEGIKPDGEVVNEVYGLSSQNFLKMQIVSQPLSTFDLSGSHFMTFTANYKEVKNIVKDLSQYFDYDSDDEEDLLKSGLDKAINKMMEKVPTNQARQNINLFADKNTHDNSKFLAVIQEFLMKNLNMLIHMPKNIEKFKLTASKCKNSPKPSPSLSN